MASHNLYILAERQEIKGSQSSLISLEVSRIKDRQSNLDKLHYLPLIMYIYGNSLHFILYLKSSILKSGYLNYIAVLNIVHVHVYIYS